MEIAVLMGSSSDWKTMQQTCAVLDDFSIPYHKEVISAHRMPDEMFTFAKEADSKGFKIIIAGAGGAAHLPGMLASQTTLPVIGVPIQSHALSGMDSLLSIVQMPGGIPVATTAIGSAGAKNAALLAVQILALTKPELKSQLTNYRQALNNQAKEMSDDLK